MVRRVLVGVLVATGWALAGIAPAQAATDWKTVSAGGTHSCGIRGTGALYCWGYNGAGQLGTNNTGTNAAYPVRVGSGTDWKSVFAGGNHTCAIRSTGLLYCWGYNGQGQVGTNNTGTNAATPKRVGTGTNWKSVSTGDNHTCATRSTGLLYCWGYNDTGELGTNNTPTHAATPKRVSLIDD